MALSHLRSTAQASVARIPGDMRTHVDGAQFPDEVSSIVALVGTKRDGARPIRKALGMSSAANPID